MAKKLGGKARKFAKKNLQSVYKRKRKLKSLFKKKGSKRDGQEVEENEQEKKDQDIRRKTPFEDMEEASLEGMLGDDSDASGDESESDGYLSEGSSCIYTDENGSATKMEDEGDTNHGDSDLTVQNKEIHLELTEKLKKLEKLRQKDSSFCKFMESYKNSVKQMTNEDDDSEDDTVNEGVQDSHESGIAGSETKLLTTTGLDFLSKKVEEENSLSALTVLINGYRSACHFGTEPPGNLGGSYCRIQDCNTFSKNLVLLLQEADNIFRSNLGISSSNIRKESILELKTTSKWKELKPLLKSFLRSTIFLLNQVTDSELLAFFLSRLRVSTVYFAAFPALLSRVTKIAVNMWATGRGSLSSQAFLFIQNVVVVFGSDWFDRCLIKMFKAFVAHCKFVQPLLFEHIQFLRNSFIDFCSQDMQKSSRKAVVALQHLAKILKLGLQAKKKEALKKICSWQFANCIDLWVSYISANVADYDLQPLIYIVIQIISGMILLFPSPRYLPLRHKCIQWLNHLSSSSGIFIPIASYALDILECKTGKVGGKPGKDFTFPSTMKVPKYWLKSQDFQQACISSAIELLATHFAKWSYHISFPELATVPLVRLRKFHETISYEGSRRMIKRFIEKVEDNVEFIQRRRDEVAFSPTDQQSVELFLQAEKYNCSAPLSFTQYYQNLMEKAASRNLSFMEFNSRAKLRKIQRRRQVVANEQVTNIQPKRQGNNNDQIFQDGEVRNAVCNGKVAKQKKKRKISAA